MDDLELPKLNLIKDLSSALPLLTVVTLVLGLMSQILFYTNFYIPIKYFIGISEIGLFFSGYLILIFLSALVGIVFGRIAMYKGLNKIKSNISQIPEKKPIVFTPTKTMKIIRFISFIAFIISIISIIVIREYAITLGLLSLSILSAYLYLVTGKKNIFVEVFDDAGVFFFPISMVIISLFFFYTSSEIQSVENGKFKGTIIKTVDSTYVSTDSSFFIGKTENWVFIYDKKKKGTKIIPTNEVKEMNIFSSK